MDKLKEYVEKIRNKPEEKLSQKDLLLLEAGINITRLEEELNKANNLYLSAVIGRRDFRQAFKECRMITPNRKPKE